MENVIVIKIRDYTTTPGRPNHEESHTSFTYEVLINSINDAIATDQKVFLDLDGTVGYSAAWLKEVFQNLAYYYNLKGLNKKDNFPDDYLVFKSEEEPYLIDDIKKYIDDVLHNPEMFVSSEVNFLPDPNFKITIGNGLWDPRVQYTKWNSGLKVTIFKYGVSITLNEYEIEKLINSLPKIH